MKSNEALLTIRQNLISIFKQYEFIFIPIIRFVLSFSALRVLKEVTQYTGLLSHLLVLIGFALIGTFASADCIIIVAILLSTLFISSFNLILGIVFFIGLSLIYILYARLFPKESLLIIVTLIAFLMKIELVVPIIAALFGTYFAIVAIMLGTILWFALPTLRGVLPVATLSKDSLLETFNQLTVIKYADFLVNQEMMVMLVIFFIVFTSIYIIRKQSMDYGPYIAIAIGAVMNILGFGLAIIFFKSMQINLVSVIIQTAIFSCIAVVLQFLSVALDYQRAEIVNFEDEENYYFVKIVPKIQLNHKNKVFKKVYTDLSHANEYHHRAREEDRFTQNL